MTHVSIERVVLEKVLDDLYAGGYHQSIAIKTLEGALNNQITSQERQIAQVLQAHGLTLVKAATGYIVLELSEITAQDGQCQACVDGQCTANLGCVAISNPPKSTALE